MKTLSFYAFIFLLSVAFAQAVYYLQMTFDANLQANPVLDNTKFLIVFGDYIAFVIVWLILFNRKFRRTQ
jgi:hypothetical protein